MSDPHTGTLRDYVRLLRANRVLIVVLAVSCCVAAAVFSSSREDRYVAVAHLSFQEIGQSNAIAGVVAAQTQTAAELAAQGAETVLSNAVLERARQRLGSPRPISELRRMLTVDVDTASNLVRIEARSTDARLAAGLANEVATGAVAIQTAAERSRFLEAARRVERQFAALRRDQQGDGGALALSFADRIATLRTLGVNATPSRVADRAAVPDAPASPKPLRDAVFGLFIGLLLGVLIAFVRQSLDRRLRDSEEVQEELDLPVLGFIRQNALGHAAYVSSNGAGRMPEQDVESFRVLRTNLEFFDVDHPPRAIAVTSPLPQEGKSTVAASVAMSFAAAGRRTLLLECDLRRPCLAERLSIDAQPGLSDHLSGQASREQVVQTVALSDGSQPAGAGEPRLDGPLGSIDVVTAGTRCDRPGELLGSERFRAFIEEVTQAYELVVVDTPPVLAVADTLKILPLMEGVLVCIRADQTTRDQARAFKAALGNLPQRSTGLVITGLKPGRESDYGYYSSAYAADR
jgi:capsular exopolysaccharide synthesis family protein